MSKSQTKSKIVLSEENPKNRKRRSRRRMFRLFISLR